jgi:hypothetical protein
VDRVSGARLSGLSVGEGIIGIKGRSDVIVSSFQGSANPHDHVHECKSSNVLIARFGRRSRHSELAVEG